MVNVFIYQQPFKLSDLNMQKIYSLNLHMILPKNPIFNIFMLWISTLFYVNVSLISRRANELRWILK